MVEEVIKHIVIDIDSKIDPIQHCIICGEVVSDLRGAMYPLEQEPLSHWASGEMYISVKKNPQIFSREIPRFTDRETKVINCGS